MGERKAGSVEIATGLEIRVRSGYRFRVPRSLACNLAKNDIARLRVAKTNAGRTFELERSVNGIGTTTTSPLINRAMPHPPAVNSSLSPTRFEQEVAGRHGFHHVRVAVF